MRQYELAIRIAQVHHLVDERKYKKALAVIQTLDMRQVRSLSDLKVFAEVYTRTEQFDAAKTTYLRIYRRSQTRRVLHRLIYLSIRTNALDEAEMYYQEFVRTNPNERDALIMRYRIDKARGVPIGRLIEILQDLKQEEYIEEWAYELAKLYHRAGRRQECIAECEDILLWFGTGEIVERAKILIDHLEERDPIPYYDDKDFTEPRKEEPNPDDTGSLPDLNEYIKKRKAQKRGERLAGSAARREDKASIRQEEKKAAKEKEDFPAAGEKENLPEADEELEKEIDRQLESYEEDEIDRELSFKAAKKAKEERGTEDRPVKQDVANTALDEFIDDYREDESFDDIDLPKKAMDGLQKLLKFGKKEEDREKEKEKDKNREIQEKDEPDRDKVEEKPKVSVVSANTGGEREYVPHSQSGTGITQDLAREISAIYEMEHKEQLQEKGVTVINDAPSNIATDLVERMNQALQNTPKRYIPSDVEEINGQDSEALEGDTKDLSKASDAWVDEAVTKDLSRHSAVINRQEKREARRKPAFRRDALEKNSARDARERLKNIVENRREQREDIAGEKNAARKIRLVEVSEEVSTDTMPEMADGVEERPEMARMSEELPANTMPEMADGVEEQPGMAGMSQELPANTMPEMADGVEGQSEMAELSEELPANTMPEMADGAEEQPEMAELSQELPAYTMSETADYVEEQPEMPGLPEELSADTMVGAAGDIQEQQGMEELSGEFLENTVVEMAGVMEEQPQSEVSGKYPADTVVEAAGMQEQPEMEELSGKPLADTAVEVTGDLEGQTGMEGMSERGPADTMAGSRGEPSEDETLLRQLLEGEVQEPEELSELSEDEIKPPAGQESLEELLGDVTEPSILAAGSEEEREEHAEPVIFGGTVFHSVEPQAFGEEDEDEPKIEVEKKLTEEPSNDRGTVFHAVEAQNLDLSLEEQLKAELEEIEKGLQEKAVYEDGKWEEPELPARDGQEFVQEVEQGGESAFAQKSVGEGTGYENKLELPEEESGYGHGLELPEEESGFGQKLELPEEEPEYGHETGMPEEEAEYSHEAELPEEEAEYGHEAGLLGKEPEYGREAELPREGAEYSRRAELSGEEVKYGQEPELPEEGLGYGQKPELSEQGAEYGQEPEPAKEQPVRNQQQAGEQQVRNQHQTRERQEVAKESNEDSVNRLSREMAAYRAPKIPVVETEYMEMPEITYDDLPTTRALQESFDYVLQLIEGELEPSHFVLMGDGTERIVGVAKRIVRVMKNSGFISRGRIAKIHAKQLNKMDLISFRSQLFGNCLLIDGAADLLFPTITRIFSIMEEYRGNFVVILADEGSTLDQLFRFVPALAKRFQYIIDISKYTSEDYE